MNIDNERILIDAGLSEEQSRVYDALLTRGPQKASALANWTGIKRGLIYKVIEQLEGMGLVSKKGGAGTVAVFSPEHPSKLMDMMENRAKSFALAKETLSYSLGSLASQFNLQTGKPNVQFYEGIAGIQKVLDATLKAKGIVYTYVDIDLVERHFKKINDEYMVSREKKNVAKKILVLDTPFSRQFFSEKSKADPEYLKVTELRLVKSMFTHLEAALQIYDDTIGIITVSESNLVSIIIEDARIAELAKSMFEALYAASLPFTEK